MSDAYADFDHRAKTQRTLSKDSAGSSQQVNPIDPFDDANKKVVDSTDMDTPMVDTADANINIAISHVSDVKDQDPSQLDMVNVEPLRNEISTDIDAAAKAGPGGDSSPQKQDEGRVAAEDANTEQKP